MRVQFKSGYYLNPIRKISQNMKRLPFTPPNDGLFRDMTPNTQSQIGLHIFKIASLSCKSDSVTGVCVLNYKVSSDVTWRQKGLLVCKSHSNLEAAPYEKRGSLTMRTI